MNYHRIGLVIVAFAGTALLVLAISASLLIRACDEYENPHSFYPKYEDAVSDGAFGRGWLPGYIPSSACNIHEQHDIDTNRTWVWFEASRADIRPVLDMAVRAGPDELSRLGERRPLLEWWWDGLENIDSKTVPEADVYLMEEESRRSIICIIDNTICVYIEHYG